MAREMARDFWATSKVCNLWAMVGHDCKLKLEHSGIIKSGCTARATEIWAWPTLARRGPARIGPLGPVLLGQKACCALWAMVMPE